MGRRRHTVAERGVEISIGTKPKPSRLVIGDAVGLIDADYQLAAGGVGEIRIGGNVITANFGVAGGVDHVDIKHAVLSIAGIEREAEQPALADRIDCDVEEWRWLDLEYSGVAGRDVDDLDSPRFLQHEDAIRIVRCGSDEHRLGQTGGNAHCLDAARLRCRSVWIESIDEIDATGSEQRLSAVGTDDGVGDSHGLPRSCGAGSSHNTGRTRLFRSANHLLRVYVKGRLL
jgi:hypothetical protein